MCSAVQTAAATIISYKPLSNLQLHALFSFGVYKPLITIREARQCAALKGCMRDED